MPEHPIGRDRSTRGGDVGRCHAGTSHLWGKRARDHDLPWTDLPPIARVQGPNEAQKRRGGTAGHRDVGDLGRAGQWRSRPIDAPPWFAAGRYHSPWAAN